LAFNLIGAMVWSRIAAGKSQEAIILELRGVFDVAPERIARDVEALVGILERERLIGPALQGAQRGESVPLASTLDVCVPNTESGGPGSSEVHRAAEEGPDQENSGRLRSMFWSLMGFLTLVYVDVLMRIFGFRRLYCILRDTRPSCSNADLAALPRIRRSTAWAERAYFKRVWCLQRSAALVLLLRRRGFPADVVLGVRTFPFEAHAWAECRGRVINDKPDYISRFLVLDRF
jgi:hypothetical protein